MAKSKRPRLGRGLSSLMAKPVSVEPPTPVEHPDPPAAVADPVSTKLAAPTRERVVDPIVSDVSANESAGDGSLAWLAVDSIRANPYQPRKSFDPAGLKQLASSIRQDGVMQPIVVRPIADAQAGGPKYELVAGERRWRAAQAADLITLPAVVRELNDQQLAEWAVIENLQREDLDPIEKAQAFARLIDRFELSHQEVADRVGIDRTSVTNTLRMLDLSDDVQELVRLGRLSGGHGRALLALSNVELQLPVAKRAVAGGLSVRATEQAVRDANAEAAGDVPAPKQKRDARSAHYKDLERRIASQLKTKVHLKPGRKKGSGALTIEFHGLDAFDDLMTKLGVETD